MEEDKTQILDSGIQEQIKLDIPAPDTVGIPVPERPTGNVIEISGELIDKIIAEQKAHEADISAEGQEGSHEGTQEWEQPLEKLEKEKKNPRRSRSPKDKEASPQGDKPKRKGRPPKSEKQAPGGGGAGRPARAPKQDKAAGQPAPAKEEAPPPPAPEQPPQPRDASRAEKEEIVYLDLSQLHPFQNHPFGVRDDVEMEGLVSSVMARTASSSVMLRTIQGILRKPASSLALCRRWPAMIS